MTHPLTAYRAQRALSTGDLAATLGVSRETVWRWENGKREIDTKLVPEISRVTGIPAADLRPDLADLMRPHEAAE